MARRPRQFSVRFDDSVRAPPADLLVRAHEILVGIAESLKGIPSTSALWRAMDAGNGEINLAGWRFEYRINHHERSILVVDAMRSD
jgi:hypothetical protein